MALLMDRPRRLADGRLAAHLLSDQPGLGGVVELVAVAVTLGCHPYSVQCAGSYKEHFDLIGERRIDAAWAHPAIVQVRRRVIAEVLRDKRRRFEDPPAGD